MRIGRWYLYRRPSRLSRALYLGAAVTFMFGLLLFAMGCATTWIAEVEQYIPLALAAAQAALGLLAETGVGIAPNLVTQIQSWGTQITNDLQNVVTPLVEQYNTATAAEQPGIIDEISAVMQTGLKNLQSILATAHVTDAATQAKITSIVTTVIDLWEAIIAFVPAVKAAVAANPNDVHAQLKQIATSGAMTKLPTRKEFVAQFNRQMDEFGEVGQKHHISVPKALKSDPPIDTPVAQFGDTGASGLAAAGKHVPATEVTDLDNTNKPA